MTDTDWGPVNSVSEKIMPVILHADDFGITRSVTQGIVSAWQDGALDRFSILANGRHLDWGRQLLGTSHRSPEKLAVHLNILQGRPLSEMDECPQLFNRQKQFSFSAIALLRWQSRPARDRQELSRQIHTEWTRQIQKAMALFPAVRVWSLDSHRHVHIIPWLWEITLKLARQFSITEIRIPRDRIFHLSPPGMLPSPRPWNRMKVRLIEYLIEQNFYHKLYSPLFMGGLYYEGEMHRLPLMEAFGALKRHTQEIEILFHPGDDSPPDGEDALRNRRFYLHPNRKKEWRFLQEWAEKRRQISPE